MTDQTDRFTAAIVQRTVAVTWPGNDRGGATPPPDDWQDRAWGQEPTLHEINEGSISGCSVLHWRDDPRSDADLIAVSLSLVSGEPQRAVAPPTAEPAASSAGRAPAADRAADELASLAVNAGRALQDEKRHYEIACQENARLRATIDRLRALADEIDAEMRTEPDSQRSAMQMEAVTRIRAALDGHPLRRLAGEAQQDEARGATCPHGCDTTHCPCLACEAETTAREAQQDPTQDGPKRVKHSGPDTKFCVLCLSGEHERVDSDAAVARPGQPETEPRP